MLIMSHRREGEYLIANGYIIYLLCRQSYPNSFKLNNLTYVPIVIHCWLLWYALGAAELFGMSLLK